MLFDNYSELVPIMAAIIYLISEEVVSDSGLVDKLPELPTTLDINIEGKLIEIPLLDILALLA